MRYEKHDDVLTYKGQSRTIKTLGWWCTNCDEAILTGAPLVAHEKAFQQFKAEVDGVLNPTEVATIRTALGLSQRKASELLGGGPRAFQKYEAGTQALSVAMSHLLRLLANDPSRLRELNGPTTAKAPREAPGRTAAPPTRKPRHRAAASR
jgi:HTH-type transcriptional regulator / antitoxin MqsA